MYFLSQELGVGFAFSICVLLLIFIGCMRSFNTKVRFKFISMIVVLLVALVSIVVDDYLAMSDAQVNFRYVTKILKNVCAGYLEMQAVLIVDERQTVKKTAAYALPFLITTAILLCAPLSHMVFYFDKSNNYIRGNLGYLVYAQGIVYAIEIIWVCFKKWKNGHQKDVIIVVAVILQQTLVSVIEEAGFAKNIIFGSAALGVLFLYMYVYAVRYNVDSVSNCFKRRCFYSDGKRYGGHTLAIVSMDLNDLKEINDNYGHKAGDEALFQFARTVESCMTKKFILYRTGGDEFMLLGIRATKDEANDIVEAVKEKLAKTPYSCSFGIAMYRSGDDFDEIVVKADKAMYADKKRYKKDNKRHHSRENEAFFFNKNLVEAE